jgi:anaerobic magnesium-protoporphyrin IX monomethyl ester cyclase
VSTIHATLITPPLTDPTGPYHSLVYVASFARANGFPSIDIVDANIEALTFCGERDYLEATVKRWSERRTALSSKPSLSPEEQLKYEELVLGQALEPDNIAQAIAIMRDRTGFYDFGRYRRAAKQLEFWIKCLSIDGFSNQFSSRFLLSGDSTFSLASLSDLMNVDTLDTIARPFAAYFHDILFPRLIGRRAAVIGLNVTYVSQLPFALWLAKELKLRVPGGLIVAGGTEVSDVWKYVREKGLFHDLFRSFDLCVVGEGESAFLRILEAVKAGRGLFDAPNVIRIGERSTSSLSRIHYEDLDSLPAPDYSLLDATGYLSPQPMLFYSPTRGCYWNQCAFCDYGLNFGTPTSPWRQRSQKLILDDLRQASQITPYVYLSVDVLAPASLLKLAQAIIDANIQIRWSAEIRLERYFNRERCETLRKSGCVAVSVGFESGNQRILDLMKKGTKLEFVADTIRNFTEAGVAVQMMGFTGFPGETFADARESIDFLQRHRQNWTVGGLGQFTLTPGAIVAQHFQDFGIARPVPFVGADINRTLHFQDINPHSKSEEESRDLENEKKVLGRTEFDRPFAGGIDTAHSLFYYSRFGTNFPQLAQASHQISDVRCDVPLLLNGRLIPHEVFDLTRMMIASKLRDIHARARADGRLPRRAEIQSLLAAAADGASPADLRNPVFIRNDGALIPCSEELWELLRGVDGSRTLDDLMGLAAQALGRPVDDHFVEFIRQYGLVVERSQTDEACAPVGPNVPDLTLV